VRATSHWRRFLAEQRRVAPRGTDGSNPSPSARESVLASALRGYRRKRPAFAGSVSLDETRERGVLARSRRTVSFSLTGI